MLLSTWLSERSLDRQVSTALTLEHTYWLFSSVAIATDCYR